MNNIAVTVRPTSWQQHQADLIKIRSDVFIHEQGVSVADELDGMDDQAIHFIAQLTNGAVIGCARLLIEKSENNTLHHIGRVAILKSFRNQGIGHQLMTFIVSYCKQKDPHNTIYLHAQTERRHFYETLGFIAEGEEFMDAGIPHISMHLAR